MPYITKYYNIVLLIIFMMGFKLLYTMKLGHRGPRRPKQPSVQSIIKTSQRNKSDLIVLIE